MKLLSCVQPMEFLGVQHTQSIRCEIPGCTAAIMQPSHVLCTRRLPGYGMTFAYVPTYFPTDAALSKMSADKEQRAVLEYSPVPKIKESEALLVRNCSKRLDEYGLMLWVVSIVLYVQESQV